jgi:hypothetical protein
VEATNPFPIRRWAAGFLEERNSFTVMRRKASLFTDPSANHAQYGLKAGRDKSIVAIHIVYSHPNCEAGTKGLFL